jgi:hypothetical protein
MCSNPGTNEALTDRSAALKGADHLDFIVQHRLFRPQSTATVEKVYDEIAPESPDFVYVTAAQVEEKTAAAEKLILTRKSHLTLSQKLAVPELSGEIERAVWQVTQAMEKAREQEEKSSAVTTPERDQTRTNGAPVKELPERHQLRSRK